MRVAQFVHTLNYGDAISGEAIALSRILREKGIENSIYSLHAHDKVKKFCRRWTEFEKDCAAAENVGEEVVFFLHYSLASPLNELFRSYLRGPRALLYHNLTPEHWFYGYNARVVADLRTGREELRELCQFADIVLADSEFNCSELSALGSPHVVELPLLLDDEKWSVAANPGIAKVLRSHGGKNILHVGRLAPNKCVEDILKSFYFYHHKIDPKSRLWLVGSDIDTEIYSFELRRLTSELRLKESVFFVGAVADSELRAFYENSDLYVCMSEHEGFCVPLLEAMHFQVPVIAWNGTAVPETLGDAGILVTEKNHAVIGELFHMAISDSALRTELQEKGRQRVKQFSTAVFRSHLEQRFLSALERVAEAPARQLARS